MKVKKFMSAIILSIVAFVTSFTVAFSAVQLRCVDCNKLLVRTHVVLGMLDYEHYFGCKEIEGLKTRRDLSYVGYRLLCVETDDGPLCYSCASNIINKKAVARDTAYTITVPESVVLNKTSSDYSGTYTGTVSVSANGFIQLDQRVYFSASNPEMYRTGSAAVTGTTTATTATDWESMDVSSGDAKTVYTVSADITPGSWNGTMMFFATVTEKFDILLGDNTTSLLAQNENAANVKFSSSAPKIATVDATGHVQTVSAGETTITKMVYDSTGKNLLYTAVYNITVSVETADMVTTRLAEPLEALTAAGTTIDTIQFGQYTIPSIYFGHYDIPSNTTTYDVSGVNDGSIVAFVSGTALKVTNTYNGPIKFIQDNGVCFYIASKPSAFKNITEVHYDYVDTSLVAYCDNAFYGMSKLTTITGLENWDTSNMTSMSYMFYYCPSITKLNVANFDTSKVTDMREMFESCNSLTSLDVSHFDTSKVTRMRYMFSGCQSLTSLDVSNFNTSNVIDMSYMFLDCHSLKELDLKAFDTKNVVSMYCMFGFSWSLEKVDISSFDTSNVMDMSYMFEACNSLKQIDVSNFDTCKVESMAGMFTDCYSLTSVDVSNFNTSKVTDFSRMFGHCFKLGRVVVGNSVLTKNLPVTGTDKGLFWVENNTHLTIVGNASSALRAYNYSGDNRTVSYVSSLRANSLNTKNILSEQTQYATPETAQRYDERPAA